MIKESITIEKWIGIFLGFFGMIIVIWPRLGGELPLIGFISCCVALTAISFGTVIQKRYLEHMEILGGNTIQAISAAIFFALALNFTEPFKFNLTIDLFISMSWLILMVSIGAISILMLLISRGRMSSTASLFFLAPPVSAILGYFIFKETYSLLSVIGIFLLLSGVILNAVFKNKQVKKRCTKKF